MSVLMTALIPLITTKANSVLYRQPSKDAFAELDIQPHFNNVIQNNIM